MAIPHPSCKAKHAIEIWGKEINSFREVWNSYGTYIYCSWYAGVYNGKYGMSPSIFMMCADPTCKQTNCKF